MAAKGILVTLGERFAGFNMEFANDMIEWAILNGQCFHRGLL